MDTQCKIFISLHPSGEVETGAAGEQPVRNSLIDWNGQGAQKAPFTMIIPEKYVLENPTENMRNQIFFL
jgi:hypothetical protein